MSISVDESVPAWKAFKQREEFKYPHFGKDWTDNDGVISGSGNFRDWKWEAAAYLRDRKAFIQQFQPAVSTQIEKSPISSNPAKAVPTKPPGRSTKAGGFNLQRSQTLSRKNNKANMPKRTKRSQAWKKGRKGRRGGNKALSSVKVPFKMVMAVDSNKSSAETGHWHNHLTLSELAGSSLKLHEEFKCCSMKVRFIPEDITTGSGLYAACLLDQGGFGDPVKSTTVWFPRVADLPGARLCHVTRGCMFSWRPTEPDSRNYHKSQDESSYVVASFYIFGNSASLSIKGQLLITGLLRARGEFYSANIASRIKALSLINTPDDGSDDELKSDSFEPLDN